MKRTNKRTGDDGEAEVARLVPCPNCGKELTKLPQNFPLFDVQCSGCSFRAQVKTNRCKPKAIVFGAGWTILEKVLKSGFLMPPLFLNFKWPGGHEIRFYPLVPRKNLKKFKLSDEAKQAGYPMFNYVDMIDLPHFVPYKK